MKCHICEPYISLRVNTYAVREIKAILSPRLHHFSSVWIQTKNRIVGYRLSPSLVIDIIHIESTVIYRQIILSSNKLIILTNLWSQTLSTLWNRWTLLSLLVATPDTSPKSFCVSKTGQSITSFAEFFCCHSFILSILKFCFSTIQMSFDLMEISC